MQAPADDAWGHWFPFVQHNPVLGDKKSWRDRAELLRRLERDGIIVAKGMTTGGEERARRKGGGTESKGGEGNAASCSCLMLVLSSHRYPGRAGVRRAG